MNFPKLTEVYWCVPNFDEFDYLKVSFEEFGSKIKSFIALLPILPIIYYDFIYKSFSLYNLGIKSVKNNRYINTMLRLFGSYVIIQVAAQDLGVKTGTVQSDFIKLSFMQAVLYVGCAFAITQDRSEAFLAALIYFQLKYFDNIDNDSWDGKDFDVTNPNAYVFKAVQSITGLTKKQTQAAIYAAMVGQDQDPSELTQLLTPEGINWLQMYGIKSPKNPNLQDILLMYNLSFPQDTGQPAQEISKATDAYNKVRDQNLIKKVKEYESKGYKVIAAAGEGHIDLINSL